MLTCMTRTADVSLKTLRLVCRDVRAAADVSALELLATTRATFNRLISEVHTLDVAALITLRYDYPSESESDQDEIWDDVARSFDTASGELLTHQQGVELARDCLRDVRGRVGFLSSARAFLHAGALLILRIAWSAECLHEELVIASFGDPDLKLDDFWEADFRNSTSRLVNDEMREADLRAVYDRHGVSQELRGYVAKSWSDAAVIRTACERAGLPPPADCDSWDRLQHDAPSVVAQARRWWTSNHQAVQRRAREEREEVARARRRACLHHGIRRMGLNPRADSALQLSCVASVRLMHSTLDKTLRCAVWMNWLHDHTRGEYKRAVEAERDSHCGRSDCDADYDGGGGITYREAVDLVQARPEFQMPAAIPWLPAPHNGVDEVVAAAVRAVHTRMVWRRAFQRIKCLLVFASAVGP